MSLKKCLNIVMESAIWIFCGCSFHNLATEVPKRRFPNRMDLFLYGTSDVNAVDCKDLFILFHSYTMVYIHIDINTLESI